MFLEHLTLISYIGPWLDALGFELFGPHCFNEALRIFSLFGQHGLHYQPHVKLMHQTHVRELCAALLRYACQHGAVPGGTIAGPQ